MSRRLTIPSQAPWTATHSIPTVRHFAWSDQLCAEMMGPSQILPHSPECSWSEHTAADLPRDTEPRARKKVRQQLLSLWDQTWLIKRKWIHSWMSTQANAIHQEGNWKKFHIAAASEARKLASLRMRAVNSVPFKALNIQLQGEANF